MNEIMDTEETKGEIEAMASYRGWLTMASQYVYILSQVESGCDVDSHCLTD